MARCPFAAWRPLPQNSGAPRITPRVLLYHTMVGTLRGVEAYFGSGRSGGIESHFGVGCPKCGPELDGAVWQWMDTNKRADANYHANAFAISVETCDHYQGGTYTNPGLSPKQVAAWIRLGNWAAEEHGIPRRRVPEWDASGFGYHSMFGAPSHYTPAVGKTCPNPTRIDQFNRLVLPAIKAGQDPEEDELTPEDKQWVEGRMDVHERNTNARVQQVEDKLDQVLTVLFNGHAIDHTRPIDNLYDNTTKTRVLLEQLAAEPPPVATEPLQP